MALTTAQLQTIKTWLLANAGSMTDQQAADALNAIASPAFKVYKTFVSEREVFNNGFDWTRVDNLSVGKSRIWDWLVRSKEINSERGFDPSGAGVRGGLIECWKGTAADIAVREAIFAHCQRNATVAEKLLATGAGTTIAQDGTGPGTMGFEGTITAQDVIDAYNS